MTTLRPLSGIAKRVHDDILRMDPEAAVEYARMVVLAGLQHDLETNTEVVQKRVDEIVSKRVAVLKEGVVRTYVSKRAGGQDVAHLQRVAETVSKAGFGNLTTEERRAFARLQGHDPRTGHFKSKTKIIRYDDRAKPMGGRFAGSIGMDEVKTKHLSRRDRAQYQQAYLQLAGMLDEFTEVPAETASVSLLYRKGPAGGLERVTMPYVPGQKVDEYLDAAKFKGASEKKLVEASVIVDGGLNVQGAAFNLVGALTGSPTLGGRAAASLEPGEAPGSYRGSEGLAAFADDWDARLAEDVRNPSNRIFRRISRGSKLLSDLGGPNLPVQAQLALQVANQVGQYGPEAQKVIGPHADRAAYRYRGVEKRPEAGLQTAVSSSSRDEVIYGKWERGTGGRGPAVHQESKVISYFQNRLPDADLLHLQRKSGVIPPSEGIIIDRKGRVVTQAVGYGDDWYLPFNLKTLSKLKGGDYIRTRTFGGPTTEDIYAGLMSGARSVTVVSHNGVYTIEFDESFRGTRRYSDKAGRMVKRYGHLLDAVKSKQVTLASIPPERIAELKAEAAAQYDPRDRSERDRYTKLLDEKIEDETENPQLSRSQVDALAEDFVTRKAQQMKTGDSYAADWTALAENEIQRRVAERRAMHNMVNNPITSLDMPGFMENEARQHVAAGFATPQAMIGTMGWNDEFEKVVENAQAEERHKRSPLQLDGEGYHKSMQALQQQFPYYIAHVDYRPKERGGYDHGYVKPRFNRPEGAKVGYYDETILGHGKLGADMVRHQNRGIDVAGIKSARKNKVTPLKEQAGAAGTPGAAPAEAGENDRVMALKALYDEVNRAQNFAAAGPAKGAKINRAQLPESVASDMAPFFTKSWADWLEEMGSDDKAGDRMVAAARSLKTKGVVDVSASVLDRAANPAKAKAGAKFSVLLAEADPNKDYDFGDPDLARDRTPEQYSRVIERLSGQIKDQASDEDLDTYIARQIRLYRHAEQGRPSRADMPKYAANVERAVKIKQAMRYREQAEKEAAEAKELKDQETRAALQFVDMSQHPELNDLVRGAQDNPRIIGGTVERKDDER